MCSLSCSPKKNKKRTTSWGRGWACRCIQTRHFTRFYRMTRFKPQSPQHLLDLAASPVSVGIGPFLVLQPLPSSTPMSPLIRAEKTPGTL